MDIKKLVKIADATQERKEECKNTVNLKKRFQELIDRPDLWEDTEWTSSDNPAIPFIANLLGGHDYDIEDGYQNLMLGYTGSRSSKLYGLDSNQKLVRDLCDRIEKYFDPANEMVFNQYEIDKTKKYIEMKNSGVQEDDDFDDFDEFESIEAAEEHIQNIESSPKPVEVLQTVCDQIPDNFEMIVKVPIEYDQFDNYPKEEIKSKNSVEQSYEVDLYSRAIFAINKVRDILSKYSPEVETSDYFKVYPLAVGSWVAKLVNDGIVNNNWDQEMYDFRGEINRYNVTSLKDATEIVNKHLKGKNIRRKFTCRVNEFSEELLNEFDKELQRDVEESKKGDELIERIRKYNNEPIDMYERAMYLLKNAVELGVGDGENINVSMFKSYLYNFPYDKEDRTKYNGNLYENKTIVVAKTYCGDVYGYQPQISRFKEFDPDGTVSDTESKINEFFKGVEILPADPVETTEFTTPEDDNIVSYSQYIDTYMSQLDKHDDVVAEDVDIDINDVDW